MLAVESAITSRKFGNFTAILDLPFDVADRETCCEYHEKLELEEDADGSDLLCLSIQYNNHDVLRFLKKFKYSFEMNNATTLAFKLKHFELLRELMEADFPATDVVRDRKCCDQEICDWI